MYRVDVRYFRGAYDRRNVQVAFRRRRFADADRLIRKADVKRIAVRLGIHGDGLDVHLLARPHYPARDLAAVGDKHLVYLAIAHKTFKPRNTLHHELKLFVMHCASRLQMLTA
jgi:hypothetical protein